MAGALMAAALVAALCAVAARSVRSRITRRARARALSERPGLRPESAVKIASFTEIDDAIDEWRCPCGGLLERVGEGGRTGLRVVRCTCVVCEEDLDLFFDLSQLRN